MPSGDASGISGTDTGERAVKSRTFKREFSLSTEEGRMVPVLNLSLLALREVDKALWREVKVTTNGQAAPVLHVVGDESAVLAAIGERGNAVDWILSMCIVGNATSQPWPEKAQGSGP